MRLLALAAGTLAATHLHAAHPLITEDTGTIGAGRWQLELFGEAGNAAGTGARLDRDDAVLSYGLARNLDLQAGLPWIHERTSGAGDARLDLKWRFLERGDLSLAFKPGVSFPTGNDQAGRGAGRAGWGSQFVASYDYAPAAFHLHLGYQRHRNEIGERESLTHVSGAVELRAAPGLRVVADVARDTNPDPAQSRAERYVVFGVIWSVTRDFDVDVGVKRGSGSAELREAILVGLAARW
jgi:hypothetical protein